MPSVMIFVDHVFLFLHPVIFIKTMFFTSIPLWFLFRPRFFTMFHQECYHSKCFKVSLTPVIFIWTTFFRCEAFIRSEVFTFYLLWFLFWLWFNKYYPLCFIPPMCTIWYHRVPFVTNIPPVTFNNYLIFTKPSANLPYYI